MKPPSFWYDPTPHPLTKLLKPFSKCFSSAASFRPLLSKIKEVPIPVICCGNLTIGGSGKTPISMDLAKSLISKNFRPHFLTRGYGRRKHYSSTPILTLSPQDHPIENWKLFGDEPCLLSKISPCWIDSNRKKCAKYAYQNGANILILDDGFQYPFLKKDLNLLLFNGEYGIGNGFSLPAGPLREDLTVAAKRTDFAIIVGEDKCNLSAELKRHEITPIHVEFNIHSEILRKFSHQKVYAFAGIAFPECFFKMLRQHGLKLFKTFSFSDHHIYTPEEISKFFEISKKIPLLTTAKDAVKFPREVRNNFHIIEINVKWSSLNEKEKLLQSCLKNYNERMKKNYNA
ncbi:tetraacyldisaccharide 4'-kinase [Acetobacteraceae bacterium]|nr:tetraacyldisaccharide 4'-kinase [Acetobacteraceae bacterium]